MRENQRTVGNDGRRTESQRQALEVLRGGRKTGQDGRVLRRLRPRGIPRRARGPQGLRQVRENYLESVRVIQSEIIPVPFVSQYPVTDKSHSYLLSSYALHFAVDKGSVMPPPRPLPAFSIVDGV